MVLFAHSYSPFTVYDIRFGKNDERESNQQRVKRLAALYAIPEVEVKLLIAADDDHIDCYGRIPE